MNDSSEPYCFEGGPADGDPFILPAGDRYVVIAMQVFHEYEATDDHRLVYRGQVERAKT